MGRNLFFNKPESRDAEIQSSIEVVAHFLHDANTSTKVEFNDKGEHPTLTLENNKQVLECSTWWYKNHGAFKDVVKTCKFTFWTGKYDTYFEFSWSDDIVTKSGPEVVELIAEIVDIIDKTGYTLPLPSSYIKKRK